MQSYELFRWECKMKSRTASVNTESQWSKQETFSACANQVWLGVNLNTRATSGE